MELYQLKTFVTVAEEGHLTRAAERLFTSQPAISAQIKGLEEELGVMLFQRTPKGMTLTPQGNALLAQAEQTLAAAGALLSEARALREELIGEVRIGVHSDYEFLRITELLSRLAHDHPRLRPHFIRSISPTIQRDVRSGQLDGGFYFGPCTFSDLYSIELADVPMRVVAPVAWGDRIADADLPMLAEMPWVYTSPNCPFHRVTETLFAPLAERLEKVVFADSEEAVRAFVQAGIGLSLMREDDAQWAEREGFAICWPGEVPTLALGFVVQKRRAGEPIIALLCALLGQIWAIDERDERMRMKPAG